MMACGFLMMARVPVGQLILTSVWIFHILYFIFGIRTLREAPVILRTSAEDEG